MKMKENDNAPKDVITVKRRKNLALEWTQNNLKKTSTDMLLDYCYAFGLLLKPSSLKKFVKEVSLSDL